MYVLYITNMAVAIILSFLFFRSLNIQNAFWAALTDAYRNCLHINKTTKSYIFVYKTVFQ